jgi:hypothetical protein
VRRLAVLFTSLALAGCVMGIPDADNTFKPVKLKPCDKIVIVQPNNVAHCMTNDEFARWVKRNLP